jgi:hypothetical protein
MSDKKGNLFLAQQAGRKHTKVRKEQKLKTLP